MSRHNLRAPLANNGSVLEQSRRISGPGGMCPAEQLTTKGSVLEGYMGRYMRGGVTAGWGWSSGECHDAGHGIYLCQQSATHHFATAQFFITGTFYRCDIPVHHQEKWGTMDPTFNPVITDDSAAFSQKAVQAMEKRAQPDAA